MTNYSLAKNTMLRLTFAWALVMVATFTMAAEPKLVLIRGDDSGLNDLLRKRLSQADNISVLERQEPNAVSDEESGQGVIEAGANGDRKTAITGADFLVLLSSDDKSVQVVVVETHYGVTLKKLCIPIEDQSQEKWPQSWEKMRQAREEKEKARKKAVVLLSDQALAVIAEFAQGIRYVVAVPDFVSHDLTFDRSFLQSDYADVLRDAFGKVPGLALVAIDEATAIAAERDISDIEQKERLVSVFIDGEYTTNRDAKTGATTVEITVRANNGEKILVNRKLSAVPLEQAGKSLLEIFSTDLSGLAKTDGDGIDAGGQYKLLTERAAQFSAIGDFRRSTALREAALLLKLDADEQRIHLIREYTRRNKEPFKFGRWPDGGRPNPRLPSRKNRLNQTVNDWKRSLKHCEYLIANRRLSREKATNLAYNAIRSISGVSSIRVGKTSPLVECEELKKRFLRQNFARIASLDPSTNEERFGILGAVFHFSFKSALFRCDRAKLSTDDLDLIAELLLTDLPDTMVPCNSLNSFLQIAGTKKNFLDGYNAEEYDAFLDRLIASKRPLAQVYGRYGKLYRQYYGKNERSVELMNEANDIVTAAEDVGFDLRKYSYFMDQLRTLARRISHDIQPQKPKPKPKKVAVEKTGPTPTSRLTFKPIKLTFDKAPGYEKKPPSETRFRWHGGWHSIRSYRPLAEGLDAFWSRGAVLFSHQPGKLTPVLVDEKLGVQDVVSDGRHVWVAGANDWGISVLDTDGNELVHISKDQGLPPCDRLGMVIHPLGPGRLLASGSFGSEYRAWIAVVSFDGQSAEVNVFHEAIKVRDREFSKEHRNTDPEMSFKPDGMFEHVIPGNNPRRIICILPDRYKPILIDPETLKVWCYPNVEGNKHFFPRRDPPTEAFLSIDGLLFVAGSEENFRSYRFDEKTSLFNVVRKTPDWHSGNARQGSLARDGDWLYYTGGQNWRRLNLRTGDEEPLLDDPFAVLPRFNNEGYDWKIAVSSHYGLVASLNGKLFRVGIKAAVEDAAE